MFGIAVVSVLLCLHFYDLTACPNLIIVLLEEELIEMCRFCLQQQANWHLEYNL